MWYLECECNTTGTVQESNYCEKRTGACDNVPGCLTQYGGNDCGSCNNASSYYGSFPQCKRKCSQKKNKTEKSFSSLGCTINDKKRFMTIWPLFTIIFRPEMLKFHQYSILAGETMVGFVIYCAFNDIFSVNLIILYSSQWLRTMHLQVYVLKNTICTLFNYQFF